MEKCSPVECPLVPASVFGTQHTPFGLTGQNGSIVSSTLTSRKLTVEAGPKDNPRAVWLRPFLQSCACLEDLSVELVGPSRRLTLPPRCIPSSTRHVYWDDPSAPQISMLLAYRSITSLTMTFDVDMPSMAKSAHTQSKIKDLGLIGCHRPPPILTDRPLWLPNVSRYYFCIHSADPDDIVSGGP